MFCPVFKEILLLLPALQKLASRAMTRHNARIASSVSMTGLPAPSVTFPHCDFRPQATEALQDHLGQMHSLASKATRGPPELQDCPGRKDGLETQGPRASLVSLVFQGRKVTGSV